MVAPRYLTARLISVIIAVIFLYSGFVKAGASEQISVTIANFSILPAGLIDVAALMLPLVEIMAGVLLLLPATGRIGGVMSAALFSMFSIAIAWALSRGIIVDCGCFGAGTPSARGMMFTLVRDVVLFGLSLFVVWTPRPPAALAAATA